MTCSKCLKEWEGRPWIMADIYSGEVHGYCETCAVEAVDDYIALKKRKIHESRNN